ncbi:MAG: type II secretion system protein [Verrucomicrobia bacterium]|nr:type II secretion system protein [Verrucomicrobiota bacterium]MDA1085668.1 type II secretion system protein [Verrucomicrobiota bacterium]
MKKKQGFTLVEIMIVVAIIGLLAAIAIPSFMKSRTTSQQNACINNLRQIESGKEQWAMAQNKTDGVTIDTAEVAAYLKGSILPTCLASGALTYNVVGTTATCNIQDPTSHVLP